jgi:hypothetical protein
MNISLAIIFTSLALAILLTVFVENRRLSKSSSERMKTLICWGILFCCYGVGVGVASIIISYFFHVRELIAVAIGVPLGLPILIFAAKMV